MAELLEAEKVRKVAELARRLPRSRSLVGLFAQQRAEQTGVPQPLVEETASFDLPDKPVRKAGQAELLALCAVAERQTGPPGRQGAWKPGPGRPRKTALVGRPASGVLGDKPGSQEALSARARRRQKQATPSRVDLSVEQKHAYCQSMAELFGQTGAGRNLVFDRLAKQIGCRAQTVRKVWDHRVVWQNLVERRGSRASLAARGTVTGRAVGRPARGRALDRESKGKRLPGARGYLGRTDPLRAERLALKAWGEAQEACGHSLGRADLFREFRVLVGCRAAALQAKASQPGEGLTEAEQATLDFAKGRLQAWESRTSRERAAKKLLRQTGFRERATNRQTKLSLAEETALLEKAWQFFDYLVWLTAAGPVQDLEKFVAKPEQFRLHANETAVVFTDQIPVWLKVEAGSQVVSEKRLEQQQKGQADRRKARKAALLRKETGQGAAEAVVGPVDEEAAQSYLVRGPGSTAAARWRISLLARQVVEGYFDPSQEPKGPLRRPRQHHLTPTKQAPLRIYHYNQKHLQLEALRRLRGGRLRGGRLFCMVGKIVIYF